MLYFCSCQWQRPGPRSETRLPVHLRSGHRSGQQTRPLQEQEHHLLLQLLPGNIITHRAIKMYLPCAFRPSIALWVQMNWGFPSLVLNKPIQKKISSTQAEQSELSCDTNHTITESKWSKLALIFFSRDGNHLIF